MKVVLSLGEQGVIEGGFGQSGKVKIRILGQLQYVNFCLKLKYVKNVFIDIFEIDG